MGYRRHWIDVALCSIAAALCLASPGHRVLAEETAPPRDTLDEQLTFGVLGEEEGVEFSGDLLVPFPFGEGGVFFLNPRAAGNDESERTLSLGLGFRQIVAERGLILGANLYYDAVRSARETSFDQFGTGLEVLSKWFDARANAYFAMDDEELVASHREETLLSARTDVSAEGAPYAEQHAIRQRYTATTVIRTLSQVFGTFEYPLEGCDVEIGTWLPSPADWLMEIGLFAGYYNFGDSFADGDVEGVKGRLELRSFAGLVFDAEVYGDDDLSGADYFVGGRLQLPLDLPALFSGGNPFAGAGRALELAVRPFRERLVENVVRDPGVHVREETRVTAEEVLEARRSDDGVATLLDDVQFVDNARASRFANGSAERPFGTIGEGVSRAYGAKNVYVHAGQGDYRENVRLHDGVSLFGEGCAIEGLDGLAFGGASHATVDGGSMGPSVTLADNTAVRGMRIVNSAAAAPAQGAAVAGEDWDVRRTGIYGYNVDRVLVGCDNLIEGNSYGVYLTSDGAAGFNAAVADSTIRGNERHGVYVLAAGDGGAFSFLSEGNTYSGNAHDGLSLEASGFDTASVAFRGDLAQGNGDCGLDVDVLTAAAGGNIEVLVSEGSYSGNARHGVEEVDIAASGDNAAASIVIRDVLADGNGESGFGRLGAAADGADGTASLFVERVSASDNRVDGFSDNALRATGAGGTAGSLFHMVAANGQATGGGIARTAVEAEAYATASFDAVLASGNLRDGISDVTVWARGDAGLADLTLNNIAADDQVSGSGIDEVYVDAFGVDGLASITMTGVHARRNARDGAFVTAFGRGGVRVFGQGNEFRDNGSEGVRVRVLLGRDVVDFGGGALGSFGQNSISGNGATGLRYGGWSGVSARNNWWGAVPPVLLRDYSLGVDASDPLVADPNP